jgi:hypothetical protein
MVTVSVNFASDLAQTSPVSGFKKFAVYNSVHFIINFLYLPLNAPKLLQMP